MENIFSSTAVLILAGGLSQRSGEIKGLRKFSGKYWIEYQIEYFLNLKMGFIFTGLGYNFSEYLAAVPLLGQDGSEPVLPAIINPTPEKGMFSTLQNSLKVINNLSWDNLFLLPVDMALPEPETLVNLLEFRDKKVVKPVFSEQAGHPILLSKEFCRILERLLPEDRLDFQIRKLPAPEIYSLKVNDPAVCLNMNTTEDWQNYLDNII
jgi:CTP:molybdopterin cytidylyltransferase MocA